MLNIEFKGIEDHNFEIDDIKSKLNDYLTTYNDENIPELKISISEEDVLNNVDQVWDNQGSFCVGKPKLMNRKKAKELNIKDSIDPEINLANLGKMRLLIAIMLDGELNV